MEEVQVSNFATANSEIETQPRQSEEDDWQDANPPNSNQIPKQSSTTSFSESSTFFKDTKTRDLRIKLLPNEANKDILDRAENALTSSQVFNGRIVLREALRSIVEIGSRPVTIDLVISGDLDRCLLVRVGEPMPDHLFQILREAFAHSQSDTKPPRSQFRDIEDEIHKEPIDGPSVQALLDQDYVNLLKNEMRLRNERDLTTFATPLERRARDDERRVLKLQKLLEVKYNASHLPLPALETPPPLSSFTLKKPDTPTMLNIVANSTPQEVDQQLKIALRKELHTDSLARQDRKHQEVLVRAEVCERNRNQLVSVLSNSRAALEADLELMHRLGIHPPQVALCRVPCIYNKRPGFLIVTPHLMSF